MTPKQFHQSASKTKTISQLNQLLLQYCNALGISVFSFSYYATNPKAKQPLKYGYSSPAFARWHQHYLTEDYQNIDSLIDVVYQATMPLHWRVDDQIELAASAKERQMRLDAKAFGAVQGLSIPIHGPNQNFAILLIVEMEGEQCLSEWPSTQFTLQNIGQIYFHTLDELLLMSQQAQPEFDLSLREMQCLQLLAKQYSVEQMALKLDIKPRTVHFHMQQINRKLGCHNKYQSLTKAIELNILSF